MRDVNAVNPYVRINPDTHLFEPAWLYRDILPYWLEPDQAHSNGTVNLTSPSPVTIPYKLPHGSLDMDQAVGNPLSIEQIALSSPEFTGDARCTVFMTDMGDQRQFMNYPIHINTFAGSGQLPAQLSESLFLPTRHQLMLSFAQLSEDPEDVSLKMNFCGKMFYTWSTNLQSHKADHTEMIRLVNKALERRKYVFPYWMTTDNGAVTVPANQSVDIDCLVGSEGHFEATHILRRYRLGTPENGAFEVELINPQTRQSLMNGKIHSMMIGDARNPQPLPAPFIVPAGQILRFRIHNLVGFDNSIYLTLRGRKIRSEFKDIAQVKREFGIVDANPVAAKKSHQAEMAGVIG